MSQLKAIKSDNPSNQVGVRELRQEASAILRRVKAGELIEITEHGTPVARLVPIQVSQYEAMVEAGIIIPAVKPNNRISPIRIKLTSGPSASEVLAAMRAEERF